MLAPRKLGKIGVYGVKTRALQRRLSFEAFGLTFKIAKFWLYLGSKTSDNPSINDIATKVFWEVPDKKFSANFIEVPIGMEPMSEVKADFSRFGYIDPLQNENLFRMHIDDFQWLGREPVVGDVFELDFFMKDGRKAIWEITDVDHKSEYEKFIVIINATPLSDNRQTADIPINGSNSDLLETFMDEADLEYQEQVPNREISPDPDPTPSDVDYRDPLQSSFLDDPTKTF
jgi:hypothetical protein